MNGKQDGKGKHKACGVQDKRRPEGSKSIKGLGYMHQIMVIVRWILVIFIAWTMIYLMGIMFEIRHSVKAIEMKINAMEAEGKQAESFGVERR